VSPVCLYPYSDACAAADKTHGRVVWIRRSGTAERRIRGGDAQVIEALEARGGGRVTVVTPGTDDSPAARVIAVLREARVIAGVHGAGLANLLFAREGSRVVEVLPQVPGMVRENPNSETQPNLSGKFEPKP
jgi:capsular polysaccharide biosynthesis protein